MTDLSQQTLKTIEAHQLPGLQLAEGQIYPDYDGFSLANVPTTITRLLGIPDFGIGPLDESILASLGGPYQKVVLLLVDALGLRQLNQWMAAEPNLVWAKYYNRASFSPLTSICPSTTASALTTLWTGVAPATHGIIGYEMWSREFGMVINNILHSAASARSDVGGLTRSGFEPSAFLGRPLLGPHLRQNKVTPTAFMHYAITRSGLSVMQLDEVDLKSYVDEADLCISLAEYLNGRPGIRDYVYAYYSDVDTLMHRFSADDPRVPYQFSMFSSLFESAFLNHLSPAVAKDTLLILIADHGSVATPIDPRYDLNNHPKLKSLLVMQPTCENRLAFLFIKQGQIDAVRDYINRTWPDEFLLLEPDTALESGLFGPKPFKEQARERLGDLIVAAKGDAYLWWAPTANHMAGRHGGLSRQEMLVPFYALPLGQLG
jgi:hypothetical protein